MDATTTFHTYMNTHVFLHNMTPLDAIRQYLLDNTIPVNYKTINAVGVSINMIANHCNTQLNMMNNNYNHNNQYAELQNRLNIIANLNNILNNIHNNID
jgi:hypothetical protein